MGNPLFQKRFHPCCGFYLQGVLRWFSVLNVLGQVLIGCHIVVNVERNLIRWKESYITDYFGYFLQLIVWVLLTCYYVTGLILSLILFKGATQKNVRHLKVYIYATVVCVVVLQTAYWASTFYFSDSQRLPNPRFALVMTTLVVKFYVIFVVYRFIDEIREEKASLSDFRDLTQYEVHEFENGHEIKSTFMKALNFDIKHYEDRFQYVKYKKDDFEIFQHDLALDKRAPLGSGAFGTVYRALLCRKTDHQRYPVAVKTTNPLSSNVEHFKALLSELKVMTFIGNHKNIVNLIGACTEDIKKRKLYIVVELCAFGNLQAYLRSQRGTFVDLIEPIVFPGSYISVSVNNDEDVTNTKDLLKWSGEIADGMDFLESRNVVHGDLAARNVLLTEQRVAKITDFGLSRQLYNYATYVKKKDSPLPWRWLALETILDMQFSTQSDIWSYGVTIWELFQLGETPWAGHKFCVDFVKDLKRGKRMDKPTYASRNIYNIMLSCWEEIRNNRPTFKKLSGDFHTILMHLNERHKDAKP